MNTKAVNMKRFMNDKARYCHNKGKQGLKHDTVYEYQSLKLQELS